METAPVHPGGRATDEAREATVELLRICNRAANLVELMRDLVAYFQGLTGCEAVGVRLREGEDFPYFESRGFPEEFVKAENRLCAYDPAGAPIRDDSGHPALGCMCGNVLCGRFDPDQPFFTANGSFWSGCTTELPASTTAADRRARTRNRCNGEGYESVALIPLRSQGETFGLFQFNDKRRGCFTAENVALLEELVAYVAIALAKLKADEALREASRFNQQVIQSAEGGIIVYGRDLRYQVWNAYMERISGISAADVLGKYPQDVFPFLEKAGVIERLGRALSGETTASVDFRYDVSPSGRSGWASHTNAPLRNTKGETIGVIETVRDITDRRNLEEQLRHSQKMEAVGRLAGGVAHDFNNLLTVINGYSEILLRQLGRESPARGEVELIRQAGERAAQLTRQLLAFSRRQVLQPKVLDLNVVVSGMEAMLRRVIGEDIELRTILGKGLMSVKADPGQIEQVILNLAVNGRDAMPGGGELTIETGCAFPGDGASSKNPCPSAGPHVLLAVRDTGVGMSEETQAHLFEPFFTTKEKGKGTGLGLSTVYGIVEQSRGCIRVDSEVGKGTTVTIYLPRADEELEPLSDVSAAEPAGRETVLVVEDERAVRELVTRVLSGRGYRILSADGGNEGLRIAGEHLEPIDLLITDVIMPGMGGRELATRLQAERTRMKVLFMSGYSEQAIGRHGILEDDLAFLQKPFTTETLLRKVRQTLDRS